MRSLLLVLHTPKATSPNSTPSPYAVMDRLVYHHLARRLSSGSPEEVDALLELLCGCGVVAGLVVCLGQLSVFCWLQVVQLPLVMSLWFGYRTVKWLTKDFTNLQWDMLLLEFGACAVPAAVPFAPPWTRLLLVWPAVLLLFKLMFSSGVCKIRSNCKEWSGLTAMHYHYETQPLPHGLSWAFHNLPDVLQHFSTFATVVLELMVPWLVFGESWARHTAFLAVVALMGLIIVSGNYGFFNYLTCCLCLSLLDDSMLWGVFDDAGTFALARPDLSIVTCLFASAVGAAVAFAYNRSSIGGTSSSGTNAAAGPEGEEPVLGTIEDLIKEHQTQADDKEELNQKSLVLKATLGWTAAWSLLMVGCWGLPAMTNILVTAAISAAAVASAAILCAAVLVPVFTSIHRLWGNPPVEEVGPLMEWCYTLLRPYHVGGSYGLFAAMTTVRGELILSGSADGKTWHEYQWKYKPGSVNRRPVFVQPGHMPRLDWRVWFLPLGLMWGRPLPDWFDDFVARIFTNSASVLGLLGSNPFGGRAAGSGGSGGGSGGGAAVAPAFPAYIRVELYDYRFLGSRNANKQFMPEIEPGEWEVGKYWQRRFITTAKTYTNPNQ